MLTTALYNSVEPVIYSFILLGLVTTIFAVIATDMFADINPENFGDLESAHANATIFCTMACCAWLVPSLGLVSPTLHKHVTARVGGVIFD